MQQGQGCGSVDGAEAEGGGKRDEVGDTRNGDPKVYSGWQWDMAPVWGAGKRRW